MNTIERYIVWIDRGDQGPAGRMSGLVKTVGRDYAKVFTSLDELCRLLQQPSGARPPANMQSKSKA